MPEQDFEVVIGNCAGKGAKVSAYDPLTNESVPVELVKDKCSADRLAVKLKSVDYPRFFLIEEAKPGVLIQDPEGHLRRGRDAERVLADEYPGQECKNHLRQRLAEPGRQ